MLISNLLWKVFALLGALLFALTPIGFQGRAKLEEDRQSQQARLCALREAYETGSYTPVEEAAFFGGDLAAALNSGMRFNELQMIATHNSYQTPAVPAMQQLYGAVDKISGGHILHDAGYYDAQTLTAQLNGGVRSLELDIEARRTTDGVTFTCQHLPNIDASTNSYSLELALEEIRLWSEYNPDHLPLTLIIEPKIWILPTLDMEPFLLRHMQTLDELLVRTLGERLYTPRDMLRGYDSFRQMRENNDWPTVASLRGKVLVLLHETVLSPLYVSRDKTTRSLAMFPMVRLFARNTDYAAFVLENDPKKIEKHAEALFQTEKLIVRTRADSFGNMDDATRQIALRCGAQMLSTDYPPLKENEGLAVFAFPDGKTLRPAK